jgi:hypothetical protein
MKFSEPTKATLYGLRRIAGDLLLIAPDQFALIGKDERVAASIGKKRRNHAGLTARGILFNTIEHEVGFSDFDFVASSLKPGEPVSLSDNKIVFSGGFFRAVPEPELVTLRETLELLDDRLSAAPVCSFRVNRSQSNISRRMLMLFFGHLPTCRCRGAFLQRIVGRTARRAIIDPESLGQETGPHRLSFLAA